MWSTTLTLSALFASSHAQAIVCLSYISTLTFTEYTTVYTTLDRIVQETVTIPSSEGSTDDGTATSRSITTSTISLTSNTAITTASNTVSATSHTSTYTKISSSTSSSPVPSSSGGFGFEDVPDSELYPTENAVSPDGWVLGDGVYFYDNSAGGDLTTPYGDHFVVARAGPGNVVSFERTFRDRRRNVDNNTNSFSFAYKILTNGSLPSNCSIYSTFEGGEIDFLPLDDKDDAAYEWSIKRKPYTGPSADGKLRIALDCTDVSVDDPNPRLMAVAFDEIYLPKFDMATSTTTSTTVSTDSSTTMTSSMTTNTPPLTSSTTTRLSTSSTESTTITTSNFSKITTSTSTPSSSTPVMTTTTATENTTMVSSTYTTSETMTTTSSDSESTSLGKTTSEAATSDVTTTPIMTTPSETSSSTTSTLTTMSSSETTPSTASSTSTSETSTTTTSETSTSTTFSTTIAPETSTDTISSTSTTLETTTTNTTPDIATSTTIESTIITSTTITAETTSATTASTTTTSNPTTTTSTTTTISTTSTTSTTTTTTIMTSTTTTTSPITTAITTSTTTTTTTSAAPTCSGFYMRANSNSGPVQYAMTYKDSSSSDFDFVKITSDISLATRYSIDGTRLVDATNNLEYWIAYAGADQTSATQVYDPQNPNANFAAMSCTIASNIDSSNSGFDVVCTGPAGQNVFQTCPDGNGDNLLVSPSQIDSTCTVFTFLATDCLGTSGTTTTSTTTTTTSTSTTTSPITTTTTTTTSFPCSTYIAASGEEYAQFYSGSGSITDPATARGNDDPVNHPPLYTTYDSTYTACDAIAACAETCSISPDVYWSFDLHFLQSTQQWNCVLYYEQNTAADFKVANSDVSVAYGYNVP